MVAREPWPGTLQGLSLTASVIRLKVKSKGHLFRGELVFTADGIGGPVVFDVSRPAAELLTRQPAVEVTLDFWPELTKEELSARLIELCAANPQKDIAGILSQQFPRRLAGFFQSAACGPGSVKGCSLSRPQRLCLVEALKATPLTLVRSGPLEKATVTRGGVCRGQIDPHTLQSRLCDGLFFAGEVIDVDGPCGGYNLQIAFSTGALAGQAMAEKLLGMK